MFTTIWDNMLVLGIPILEKILRPIIVYVFLIVGLRLAGKRGLASLNSFDLVVLLCISNTVQNAIIGNDNSVLGGILGASTLLAVNYIVVRFYFEHPALDKLAEGDVTILVQDGKIIEENLRSELITHGELLAAAHKQGITRLEDVERAELEPGGALTFVQKTPTPAEERGATIIQRLDDINAKLEVLTARLNARDAK